MSAYYPPGGFNFRVAFTGVSGMDGDDHQRFQEVSGLSFEIETEPFTEGGENRFEYKLPKRVKYTNLVLKRGLITSKVLTDWINSAKDGFFWASPYPLFQPADILVTLMNDAGEPVAVWNVVQAYPVKWSMSDFNATANNIVVETLELAYQYFERQK
ncbi:MAG: phage tail protein [Bacteroidetes bacterium]|nr:phage tail protein [Bacteroidota bacterium]